MEFKSGLAYIICYANLLETLTKGTQISGKWLAIKVDKELA
jgi:hypothetical protein